MNSTQQPSDTERIAIIPCQPEALTLSWQGDQVMASTPDHPELQPVRLVWLQPVNNRSGSCSVLTTKKKELCYIPDLAQLSDSAQQVARASLANRYPIATVQKVLECRVVLGNRYFKVQTDLGERLYLIKDPSRNISMLSEQHVLIRDVQGNRFEIPDMHALDDHSRKQLAIIL